MVVPVVIPPVPWPTESTMMMSRSRHSADRCSSIYSHGRHVRPQRLLRQAIELYFTLIFEHDGTEQAIRASDRLMAIAQDTRIMANCIWLVESTTVS